MSITRSLNELLDLLGRFNHPIVDLLSPGLTRPEITQKLSFLERDIPEVIFELFEWRSGRIYSEERPPYGINILWPSGTFYSLEDCINIYKSCWKSLGKEYFPVFASIGGEFWCINMDEGYNSFVYLFAPTLTHSSKVMSQFDSLEIMIDSFISAIENKVYVYDGGWITDPKLYFDFFKHHNPKSIFWNHSKRYGNEGK